MNDDRKLLLLLVDDDEEHIEFMSLMLSREAPNLTIAAVNSSRECLEYIGENDVDCILADYQMPDMNGMELLEHLRKTGDHTPFIFHTGQGNEEVARQAFILGASDYFTKDVGFAHYARIINSVEQAVSRRAAENERRLAEEALRNTAEGVSAATGETFFRSLVEYLAKTLEVDYAFIGRLSEEDKTRVQTVCVYAQGEFVKGFEYGLAGTPCENVAGKKICYLQKDVQKKFPGDKMLAEMGIESYAGSPLFDAAGSPIGLLVLLNRKPLTKIDLTTSLLKIFASRASAELERMSSVQALSESESKFRGLVEDSNVGVVIVQDERFAYLNPRYAEIIGYTKEELYDLESVYDVIHPDDVDLVTENIRRRVDGEIDSVRYHFRMVAKDGRLVHVEAHGTRTTYKGRTALVGTIVDVTERMSAEEALIARNQELFALNEVAEVIANTPDLDGMLEQVLEKTLSLPVLNVENKGIIFLTSENSPQGLVMTAKVGIGEEHALCEKDIKMGWCLCGIAATTGETIVSDDCFKDPNHMMRYPGMTPHGHVVAPIKTKDKVLGVMTFYTPPGEEASPANVRLIGGVANQLAVAIENHRLFQKIASAKNEWEETFDAIQDMVTILDDDFNILRANRAATRAAGMDETTIIGKKYQELFKASGRQIDNSQASSRVEFTEKHTYYEYTDDGRHYEVSIYPVYHERGGTAFVHIVKDITEQRKLEEQLRHSQKMEAIGQLAGGIAHDYNNITATIIACANVLQLKLPEDNQLRTYVDQIMSSSDRATRLTKSLLAFGRKQLLSPAQVEINELIARAGKLLSRLIGEDIHLNIRLSKNPLTVLADYTQIEQVLMNLSTNSRDAMDGGGSITIRTKAVDIGDDFIKTFGYGLHGKYALITFSDTGKGMHRDMLGSIFEPFYTTKDVGKGTGLGLSIVYGIIKQHGGYINVYSEPGKGAEFKIYLPLVEPSQAKPEEKEFIDLPGGSETILLAEDDDALRKITSETLESVGYTVITAVDGLDALEKFMDNKDSIDLMLLDVVMPKMNGRELYESIIPLKPKVRAIFMSGYTNDIITRKGGIGTSLEFISKPAAPEKLLMKIREVLDAEG